MKSHTLFMATFFTIMMLTISACSLPIKVQRIDSVSEPANGIRYILKRPRYFVGLQFSQGLLDLSNIGDEARKCFYGKNVEFKVLIGQDLDGPQLTYEVTTPNGLSAIPHILSDTELVLSTDADATLKSISAGETDKSLEFIQAIAGIALKAAGLDKPKLPPRYCAVFADPEFIKYAKKHQKLLQRHDIISDEITRLQSLGGDGQKVLQSLEAVALLRIEQKGAFSFCGLSDDL